MLEERQRLAATDASLLCEPADEGAGIMLRVQRGDGAAFEELCKRYRSIVFEVGLKILGQPAMAEDLTQMVFLKIWTRPAAFRGGFFERWIVRVARNRAVDELRRGRDDVFFDPDADGTATGTPYDRIFARLEAESVRELLQTLDERRRSLIELNFFDGKSHPEIAELTGLPLGTVKTRIRTGIRCLREALKNSRTSDADLDGRRG
jgi:RNA polymerase sigma-70 factor (ECF subfamily)